jgi:hypothetical protein
MFLFANTEVTIDHLAPWGQMTASAVMLAMFVWMITKWFPQLLERHDVTQERTREHFEKILDKIEANREKENAQRFQAAKEGHDAAKALSHAIEDNTSAINSLSNSVKAHV